MRAEVCPALYTSIANELVLASHLGAKTVRVTYPVLSVASVLSLRPSLEE